jgi:25S rRNA (adenine2142-N1)-methyltransferase
LQLRLLDVGALSGTAYAKFPWISPCYIDLNPQNDNVIKSDFFSFPVPSEDEEKYDCVSLSLVANFEGDLVRRGEMLIHAHSYLGPRGWMYLVLPLACVSNSRYLDHDHLRRILDACGWSIVTQSDSKRLTRWLCQRKQPRKGKEKEAGWDGTVFKKTELRKGPSFNNFCIRVRGAEPSVPDAQT